MLGNLYNEQMQCSFKPRFQAQRLCQTPVVATAAQLVALLLLSTLGESASYGW